MIKATKERRSPQTLWIKISMAAVILAAFTSPRILAAQSIHKAGNAKDGAALFQKYCVTCHNKEVGDTSIFGPPNLHGIFIKQPPVITPKDATEIIVQGKGVMPAFGNQLKSADIDHLLAYLKTQ